MDSIKKIKETILHQYYAHSASSIFTVAISGIDASGKGYIAKLLEDELKKKDLSIANINVDPWQHPITVRLQKENPAEIFYKNVFRWNDFFSQLIIPLQKNRSIHLETMLIRTNTDEYYPFTYDYKAIDILLIEGIFLFKKELLNYYDYNIWIDCSFEKGMKRAIERNAEKLNETQLIHDYNTYYYPAQQYHFDRDNPKVLADHIFDNN